MEPRKLTTDLSVASQLTIDEIPRAAEAGFRAIIINRPDGETDDQPASADVIEAARHHGLETSLIPVTSGDIDDDDVAAFAAAVYDLPKPILAYCRTGTRSAMLWALSQAGHRPTDAIIARAAEAGYDLESLRPRLDARAAAGQGAS